MAGVLLAAAIMLGAVPPAGADDSGGEDPRGRYLIVLRDSSKPQEVATEHERRYGADVSNVYRYALKGYAARLPEEAVAAVERDPRVAFVETDQVVEGLVQQIPTGIQRVFAPNNSTIDIDGSDDVRVDVDVAIIDTGVDANHPDLNVVSSTDCTAGGSLNICADSGGLDDHGHGTHVAGTTAALDNDLGVVGVAPGARLHGVKVLSAAGSGLISWVIAGVDWVTARADTIEVANMSLGCRCWSKTLDQSIAASVDTGVVYVVAAGNDDIDAKEFSPANHADVITVSALADFDGLPRAQRAHICRTDQDDTLADFSNWGTHIEVAAPGVCILSTSLAGGYRTLSGTSMASPHVAGAAAVLTSGANDPQNGSDVAAVRDTIVGAGNRDWIDDSGDGIQEPLLDVGNSEIFVVNSPTRTLGSGAPPPSPENQPPVPSFTHSCSGMSCSFDATGTSDPDGSIADYAWEFGDGTTGSGATVSKTYGSSGTYTVRLTVTDDGGATATTSKNLSVSSGNSNGSGDFSLNATGVRIQGTATIQLDWRGTDRSGTVVVYRNSVAIGTTPDDGSYTDVIENSSGSIIYKLCEEGTNRCSNEARIF